MSEQIADTFIENIELEAKEPWGKPSAFLALCILMPLAFWLIYQTNLREIYANSMLKRSSPYEQSATRSYSGYTQEDKERSLDIAIAIREQVIQISHNPEEYYFTELARLYIIKARRDSNEELFEKTISLLQDVKNMHPLDPTATGNIARAYINYGAETDDQDKKRELFENAIHYYNKAIALMPANLDFRRERSQLLIELLNDCSRGLGYYLVATENESPPSYAVYHTLAGFYATCADMEPQFQRTYQQLATEHLEKSVLLTPNFPPKDHRNLWWDLADYRARFIGDFDGAIAAYEQVRALTIATDRYSRDYPLWKIDLAIARLYLELRGDRDMALQLALRAEEDARGQQDELTAFIEMLYAIEK